MKKKKKKRKGMDGYDFVHGFVWIAMILYGY